MLLVQGQVSLGDALRVSKLVLNTLPRTPLTAHRRFHPYLRRDVPRDEYESLPRTPPKARRQFYPELSRDSRCVF